MRPQLERPPQFQEADSNGDIQSNVPESFCVKDEATANWVVRKITEARAYAQHVKQWAEKEICRAEHEEEFFMARFESELSKWATKEIGKFKGKRKSLNLPAGSVGFRSCAPKLVIDDEVAVLSWARKSCPAAIATVEHVSKSEVKEHLEQTGEVPDGAHVEPASERFYVR